MRKQLIELRGKMAERKINAYIIPTTDFHGSEYVHEYFKCREYVSGFTGSAGTLAVTENAAALWTDGRYFLQAAEQLEGSGIELMREGEPNVPELTEWLKQEQEKSCGMAAELRTQWIVGFDGRIMNRKLGEKLAESFSLESGYELVGEIWQNRPELKGNDIYALPLSVTGESTADKLMRIREKMAAADADCHLISSLEETAWLFNLRGSDIPHTPVFYAFTLIMPETVRVYLLNTSEKVKSLFYDSMDIQTAKQHEKLEIKPYFEIFDDLAKLGKHSIMMDGNTVSFGLAEAVSDSAKKIFLEDPAILMKAIKNETEISCTRQAHIRDGAAVTEFIYRLKSELAKRTKSGTQTAGAETAAAAAEPLTELGASKLLWEERKKQGAFDTSFDTIAAYGKHGAIIHYEPTEESDAVLKNEGFLLLDSGGQYADGTTDITRTIALGDLTEEMKRCYTAVLKSHITLARAVFDENMSGADLDKLARKPLRDEGMDYKHGTGHGVGHLLGVHEGPNTISPRGINSRITAGMITSNEPGVYFEGKFGIRLENEILCVEIPKKSKTAEAVKTAESTEAKPIKAEQIEVNQDENGEKRKFAFETISFCPFEREAILEDMLTAEEKAWLNSYHEKVYEKLEALLTEDARKWLKEQIRAI